MMLEEALTAMTEEELREGIQGCCRALRLSQRMAEQAMACGDRSQREAIYRILKSEVGSRTELRLSKKMTEAGFPARYELEDFDDSDVVLDGGLALEGITDLRFSDGNENLIMYGRSGTGKTMLATILGIRLVRKGASVRFFRTNSLIKQLSARRADGKLWQFLAHLKKAGAIILDEFGYVPPDDPVGTQLLFDLVSEVHKDTSIILTTSLEFSQWDIVFQDKRVTEAFLGRIMEGSHILLFQWTSHHLKAHRAGTAAGAGRR